VLVRQAGSEFGAVLRTAVSSIRDNRVVQNSFACALIHLRIRGRCVRPQIELHTFRSRIRLLTAFSRQLLVDECVSIVRHLRNLHFPNSDTQTMLSLENCSGVSDVPQRLEIS
jgi:hypothetical protein